MNESSSFVNFAAYGSLIVAIVNVALYIAGRNSRKNNKNYMDEHLSQVHQANKLLSEQNKQVEEKVHNSGIKIEVNARQVIEIIKSVNIQREQAGYLYSQVYEGKVMNLANKQYNIVRDLNYKSPDSENDLIVSGVKVFSIYCKQLNWIMVRTVEESVNYKNVMLSDKDLCNLAYTILYYGMVNSTEKAVKHHLRDIDNDFINHIWNIFRIKKAKYNSRIRFFGGNQSNLGHYFRHLFHCIKFIDENERLNDKEKKMYVKFFRTQLSAFEQLLLAVNSLSEIGSAWISNDYINRYDIIKNIPINHFDNINIRDSFDDVNFEY